VIDTMDCAQARISLGVYVLGALEPAERTAVDAHLATCEGCRAELANLEGLPAVLASLSEEAVAAIADGWVREPTTPLGPNDSTAVPGSADRPADRSPAWAQRKAYRTTLLSVAAVVVIGLGAVGAAEAGIHVGQAGAGPYAGPALGPWQSAQGSNAVGIHAIVRYRRMGWGTQVAVQVTGIPLNTSCAIKAYERNGTTTVGGSWITDSNEGKIWYTASAGVSKNTVTKFVITTAGQQATVITIPI
jgi:anti-sigma factor RsiW